MLKYYQRRTPSLLMTWSDLPQKLIDKTIVSFRNKLRSCVAANRGTIALIALIAYCPANVRDLLRKYTRSLVCDWREKKPGENASYYINRSDSALRHCRRRDDPLYSPGGGHGSLGPRESATETASRSLDRFIRLCKAHGCYNRHTDRPRYVATFAAIARYQNSPFYVKIFLNTVLRCKALKILFPDKLINSYYELTLNGETWTTWTTVMSEF